MRRSDRFVGVSLALLLATAITGCAPSTQSQSPAVRSESSATPVSAEPTPPAAASATAPSLAQVGAWVGEVPLMSGASRIHRESGMAKYVLHGDRGEGMYSYYRRELGRRGWRCVNQAGAAAVYVRQGASLTLHREWLDNGDTLVTLRWRVPLSNNGINPTPAR